MTRWSSLYLLSESQQAVVEAVQHFLSQHTYTPYNPFAQFPAVSFPLTLKTFIAPVRAGWVRLLLDSTAQQEAALAADLSRTAPTLLVTLSENQAVAQLYLNGESADLDAWLATQRPVQVLQAAPAPQQIGDVVLDDLPPDLRTLASQVDQRQAAGMFQKLAQQILGDRRGSAQGLLANRADWNHPAVQPLRVKLDALLPDGWREPDFARLRAAWTAHHSGTSLPGDREMLASVPDALQYIPCYGGKVATGA